MAVRAPQPAHPSFATPDPLKETAKTKKHRSGVSTRALVILGALVVIVLAEVVIFLALR
jgi:hypothetical protein